MTAYDRLLRPILFRSGGGDPEKAHERTLAALTRLGALPPARSAAGRWFGRHRSPVDVAGISFPGRVGLAAGMDKNGLAVRAWAGLGFGFAELGTVTAQAQPGNDRPRLFRLPQSSALINRMGFNNAGAEALARRLAAAGIRRGNNAAGIPLGISIGKTKITPVEDAVEDYLASFAALSPYADYVAVNVSSPNTPGLRRLQDADSLRSLAGGLVHAARTERSTDPVPIFVKIAPDLGESAVEDVLDVCRITGVSGLIATNTTLRRSGVSFAESSLAKETGGLSGAPLTNRARQLVRFLRERTELPIIGVGGIMTADDGRRMFDAGADLLQLYTGFVYGGPGLVDALNRLPECNTRLRGNP
ncbi:quinone-dependent dihydroorotate dehydrogenase [Microlunatus ginsengisoli]|uniref:Dihydroorotate dehydrogenase (quinone) n=1 Tax=Microlunatus ginsengisoli TaxID=363863 RepID=A0ABP7AF26_9ACTN